MIKLADKYRIIFKIDNSYAGVSFVEGMGISGYKDLDFVVVYQNKQFEAFLPEGEIRKASEIGLKFCADRVETKKVHGEINQLLKKVRIFWAELDEVDLSKLSSKDLKDLYVKYVDYTTKLYDYFSLTEFYYFEKVEEIIEQSIFSKVDRAKLLTSPKLANILTKEKLERLKLALKIKEAPGEKDYYVSRHLNNYEFIPYADGNPKWDVSTFNGELEKLLKRSSQELDVEVEEILESDRRLIEEQKSLELPDIVEDLVESVKEWQEIKWALRIFINRTFLTINSLEVKFLREIAKRFKYTIGQVSNMYYQETLDLLDGKKIDKNTVKARFGLYAAYNQAGRITFLFGNKVEDFAQKVRERTDNYYQRLTEFKGRVASPGLIKGKARVFGGDKYSFRSQLNRMKKGEILVAESTSPEFMPAIVKASAIVADEGGITSHAAIISRELKIPCVVGTHFALRNIKDGDFLEVDANNGVVRVLRQ